MAPIWNLLPTFTDEEIIKLSKLKQLVQQGFYSEETLEYHRLLYLEYIYQSGRIKD